MRGEIAFFKKYYRRMILKIMNAIAARSRRVMIPFSGVAYKLSSDWSNVSAMLEVAAIANPV
jgi:hypothetical protein